MRKVRQHQPPISGRRQLAGYGLMLLVIAALFAMFVSHEVAFALFGRTTSAAVVSLRPITGRVGSTHAQALTYAFTDDKGRERTGSDRVDWNWATPPGGRVAIVYYGDRASRLAASGGFGEPMFFGLLAAVAASAVAAIRWDDQRTRAENAAATGQRRDAAGSGESASKPTR